MYTGGGAKLGCVQTLDFSTKVWLCTRKSMPGGPPNGQNSTPNRGTTPAEEIQGGSPGGLKTWPRGGNGKRINWTKPIAFDDLIFLQYTRNNYAFTRLLNQLDHL